MSSTGSLRKTDRGSIAEAFSPARVATIMAAILLTTVIVSFRPFQPGGAEPSPEGGGDIVNQLGFSMLGAVALFAIMAFAKPRVIAVFFSPCWLLLMAFFMLSVLNAADPSAASRAAFFTVIGIVADRGGSGPAARRRFVLGDAGLRRHHRRCRQLHRRRRCCRTWPSTLPNSAEPEHAGLWRGLFAHKNLAGPVMACFSFAGLYLMRRGWRFRGLFLLVAAMIFMANTGSKTTAGLVPLTIMIVVLPGLIGMRQLTVALFALAVVGTGLGDARHRLHRSAQAAGAHSLSRPDLHRARDAVGVRRRDAREAAMVRLRL